MSAERLNLTNIILSATDFTSNIGTCIDLILTNDTNLVVRNDVTPPFCSTHSVISVEIKFNTFKQYKRVITDYSMADYVNLRKDLQDTNLDNKVFTSANINEIYSNFLDTLKNKISKYIPPKIVTIRPRDKAFMTNKIRRLMRKEIKFITKPNTQTIQTTCNNTEIYLT